MNTVTGRLREKRLAPLIRERSRAYESVAADIQSYQLTVLNRLWANIQVEVPYYKKLLQSGTVPTEITCWDDFASFPILTRSSLQEDAAGYVDRSQKIVGWSVTGGSTGTPFRSPHWASEKQTHSIIAWLGRGL